MINFRRGKVIEITEQRDGLTEVMVSVEGDDSEAINYDDMTGDIQVNDEVILNTTAVDLNLGSGGKHFIVCNLRHLSLVRETPGHIIKLRYTPFQLAVLSSEEEKSSLHAALEEVTSLEGMPVIVGTLHSQLPAVVATIKELAPETKIAYVMTDGASLPLVFSNLVRCLKELKLIDTTVTCGHAFGGDLEAVNVYSALAAAKVSNVDITVVMMGPGVVGTNTGLGFSGIEQGQIVNAAGSLGGRPIAIPRLSFKDRRPRHLGISHHTLTSLSIGALTQAVVPLPQMPDDKMKIVKSKLSEADIESRHRVEIIENNITLEALAKNGLDVTTMGRTVEEEPEFFEAAGAAGIYAVRVLRGEK